MSEKAPQANFSNELCQEEVHDPSLLVSHLLPGSDDGGFEGMPAGTGFVLHVLGDRPGDELLDLTEILVEQRDDLLGPDVLAGVIEPTVVIGGEGDRAIA